MKVINYVMNLYQIIKDFRDLEFLYVVENFFLMQRSNIFCLHKSHAFIIYLKIMLIINRRECYSMCLLLLLVLRSMNSS